MPYAKLLQAGEAITKSATAKKLAANFMKIKQELQCHEQTCVRSQTQAG